MFDRIRSGPASAAPDRSAGGRPCAQHPTPAPQRDCMPVPPYPVGSGLRRSTTAPGDDVGGSPTPADALHRLRRASGQGQALLPAGLRGVTGAEQGVDLTDVPVHTALSRRPASADTSDPLGGTAIPSALAAMLSRRRGGGTPVPPEVAEPMGQLVGVDLSTVRVHTDAEAQQISRHLQADAFTYGRAVYFAHGRFEPSSQSGQHLLAHELAHVAQAATHGGSAATIGRIDDPAEAAADRAADRLSALRRHATTRSQGSGTHQPGPRRREHSAIARSEDRPTTLDRHDSPERGGDQLWAPEKAHTVQQSPSGIRRRVGFEIQTNLPMTKEGGKSYGYRDRTFSDKITDPAGDRDPYFHIEADLRGTGWERQHNLPGDPNKPTSIMEFVTGAFDTLPAGELARTESLRRIDQFMQTVGESLSKAGKPVKLTTVANDYEQKLGPTNTSVVEVLADDAVLGEDAVNFKPLQHAPFDELASAQPQTTFAIPLDRLPEGLKAILQAMVTTLDAAKKSFTPEQIANEKAQAQVRFDTVIKAEKFVEGNLKRFGEIGDRASRLGGLPVLSRNMLKGLLVLIEVFILEPRELKVAPPYAKAYFTFMHRIDFNSLFRSLPDDARLLAGEFLNAYAAYFEHHDEIKQLLPLGLDEAPDAGPTTADWLQSIHQPGHEAELSGEDRVRISRLASKAVKAMSLEQKTPSALALFKTTPLGQALARESSSGDLGKNLSVFAAEIQNFQKEPKDLDLDLGRFPAFAGVFEKVWDEWGALRRERFVLAGLCAKQLKAAPLTEDEYGMLTKYAAQTVKRRLDDELMAGLEGQLTTEYLQRDLLSRGKITEGAESASMGRWGLEKAQQEGAILELRAMPTGVTPADWNLFTKAAYEAIKKSGG